VNIALDRVILEQGSASISSVEEIIGIGIIYLSLLTYGIFFLVWLLEGKKSFIKRIQIIA
jgi:hypothetical protein